MAGTTRGILIGIAAMAVVVTASNILVQHPFNDWLTWGAFTYPLAFLVTDLSNRWMGAAAARRVVVAGFVLAVALSIWFAGARIALASGTAFLVAQLLDVAVFDRLRAGRWWRAPLVSSTLGSAVDTALFFTLAFAPAFAFLGDDAAWAQAEVALLGVGAPTALWISLMAGDFGVKMALALIALLPFRLAIALVPRRAA